MSILWVRIQNLTRARF